jgi:hypothetical protein
MPISATFSLLVSGIVLCTKYCTINTKQHGLSGAYGKAHLGGQSYYSQPMFSLPI